MEAVLNCTKILTTQAQYVTELTGEFGTIIQHTLMNSLRYNSLYVIDTNRVTKRPTVPRIEKPVTELSLIGKETLCREQLKDERCFCGNVSEVVSGAPVVNSCHDMKTLQLDIRTLRSQHMSAEEMS